MIEQKGWSDGMLSMPVLLEVFLGWGVMVMKCGEEDDSYTQCSYLSIYLVQVSSHYITPFFICLPPWSIPAGEAVVSFRLRTAPPNKVRKSMAFHMILFRAPGGAEA
jgi:hypothetical protein